MKYDEFMRRYRARLVERGYCNKQTAADYPGPDRDQIDGESPEDHADEEIAVARESI